MEPQPENDKIELKQRLARALRIPSNKICADCPETRPTWISFIKPQQKFALGSKVLASFVCLECAGLHRKLGTHICVVRSISHDQFEEKDVEYVEYSGNEVVNEIFEGHLQKSTMDGINIKPVLGAEVARRERFIRQKYVDLYFYRKRAHYEHIAEVNRLMATIRKPFNSAADKETPTKPFRKKLKKFLNDDPLTASDRDALTLACSTTVGNTTATNTSRTRTLTDREDSIPSDSPLNIRRTVKRAATRLRSARNNRTPNSKTMSSQEKLTDPMFGIPFGEEENAPIGETSTPERQANVRSDLQMKDPMIPTATTTATKTTIKDRGRSDLSGMILVFDEDSFDADSTQKKNEISNELNDYRRTEVAEQTMELLKLQNSLMGGFTRKPLTKTTSDERDKREVHTSSPGDVRRTRSEITMDEITRKHDGLLSMHLERLKQIQNAVAKNAKGRQVPLAKDTSTRKLNIPYLNSVPMSTTSVEGIVSVDTSFGFGDHTVNGMSGTGSTVEVSGVEPSICTVHGFRSVGSEAEKPESKGSFTEQFQNKKEADGAIKEQTQRSLIRSHMDEFCEEGEEFIDINKSNRSLSKSNTSLLKQRSIRSIGEESSARIYLQRQKSQGTMDCDSPPTKKKRSSRSLTTKSKSKSSRSRSLSNKSASNMGIDKSAARKKGRRPKSLDPSKTKKKKKSSRSVTKSPAQKKKKSSRSRSLTKSPSEKKKKSIRSLTKSPSEKKKKSIRSLTKSPAEKKKKSIRCITDSPSKKKTKKVKKSSRSLTNSPKKDRKRLKKKSTRSLSNKSSTSIGNDDHKVRKRLRRPKSKSNMDCVSPASTKGEKRLKKKVKKSRSKSRSRNAEPQQMGGMQALLDEWERLRDENKREFDRMRRENKKKFADFDRHFSQHISMIC